MGPRGVRVVTGEPGGALARAAEEQLRRAGHAPEVVGPELTNAEGVLVLVDDTGLPIALPRLYQLLPGRSAFPNAIVVVERPAPAAGLLAEGFRDVVSPAEASDAVDAVLRNRPPVLLTGLRREIENEFVPRFMGEMRQRAQEKQTLITECLDLVRAGAYLQKRLFRLHRRFEKQAVDELLGQEARIEDYLATLDERRTIRLGRMPTFPAGSPAGGVLGRREPRFRRAREEMDDAIDWLRQAGYLRSLGKAGLEAMTETASTLQERPLQGLRDCLNIIERETALRLSLIDRLQTQVNPIAVLEERCLERYGFGILPPGIALPESVHLIIRSVIQPPAEIYLTWCLDLRDLRVKQCGEVIDEVTRDIVAKREGRPPAMDRPGRRELLEQGSRPPGPAHRM
jgi:hypothetical protein